MGFSSHKLFFLKVEALTFILDHFFHIEIHVRRVEDPLGFWKARVGIYKT